VGVVDLSLEALERPSFFLILGVEVYAAVGAGFGHNINFKLEVCEDRVLDRPDVEKMAPRPGGNNHAVANCETSRIFARFPAVQGLAVEQRYPSIPFCLSTDYPCCGKQHKCSKQTYNYSSRHDIFSFFRHLTRFTFMIQVSLSVRLYSSEII